jgi:hypothetical protein
MKLESIKVIPYTDSEVENAEVLNIPMWEYYSDTPIPHLTEQDVEVLSTLQEDLAHDEWIDVNWI